MVLDEVCSSNLLSILGDKQVGIIATHYGYNTLRTVVWLVYEGWLCPTRKEDNSPVFGVGEGHRVHPRSGRPQARQLPQAVESSLKAGVR